MECAKCSNKIEARQPYFEGSYGTYHLDSSQCKTDKQRIADLERELNSATHGGCGKPGHTTSPTDPLEGEDSTAYCLTCKLERELAEERENNSANANNVARLLHENLQLEEALAEARKAAERQRITPENLPNWAEITHFRPNNSPAQEESK
jgi:hypothetical protein